MSTFTKYELELNISELYKSLAEIRPQLSELEIKLKHFKKFSHEKQLNFPRGFDIELLTQYLHQRFERNNPTTRMHHDTPVWEMPSADGINITIWFRGTKIYSGKVKYLERFHKANYALETLNNLIYAHEYQMRWYRAHLKAGKYTN